MAATQSQRPRIFPSTAWTSILSPSPEDEQDRGERVEKFLRLYAEPMRSHLRWRFRELDEHRLDDIVQSFVLDRVISAQLFEKIQRGKGRFRNYLRTCLDRFAIDFLRRDQRYVGGSFPVSGSSRTEAPRGPDPFELEWARTVLAEAVERLRLEAVDSGRHTRWEVFKWRVLVPTQRNERPVPYAELAARLGCEERELRNQLVTAQRALRRHVISLVGGYEKSDREVHAELHSLMSAVQLSSSGDPEHD